MATTLAIVALALLLTGAATATVYALPVAPQVNGVQVQAQTQNGDMDQTQDRLRLQDCDGNMTQAHDMLRVHSRDCAQNRTGEGNGNCNRDGSESITGHMYMHQNRLCEQVSTCIQNRNEPAQ